MGRWNDRWWPPPSKPRPAKGGIRSRSRRGAFAESWWGRRWIEVLEGFRIGARLQRGRSYARRGQVLDVQFEPGEITARVQGSRARPYEASLKLEPLSPDERRAVARELADRPRLVADLLTGEMPRKLEEAFLEAGVPLFPARHGDLQTECSCPDWSNPCKHIAAVYYLVAEELDRDPFLLLRLRGLGRRDLVAVAGDEGGRADQGAGMQEVADETADALSGASRPAARTYEPLPSDPTSFWTGEAADPEFAGSEDAVGPDAPQEGSGDPAHIPTGADAAVSVHLRSLGGIPFWRGAGEPTRILEEMIRQGRPLGIEILAGPESGPEEDD
jgi:uncharacterized Zn finger protein